MAEIKFAITENVGVLSEGSKNWAKEINLVSWNDRKAKVDIRDWDEMHEKMGKGVTLNKAEVKKLRDILNQMELDELDMD
ncbi:MAG: PC4/YdbC family ssDNA-binding protein [Clostridiales bacterium]|nr:PC4/YdbC family ssDNA-binding protein [Clostridiales bacterium]